MRLIFVRAAIAMIAASVAAAANAETFYGYCVDNEHSNVISSFFTYEGDSGDYDEIKDQWEKVVSAQLGVETYKVRGYCYASSDRAKAETPYNDILGYTDEYLIPFAPKSQEASVSRVEPAAPRQETAEHASPAPKPAGTAKSAAQIAAEERAARAAAREAEFQKKQAEYERQLAEQQEKVKQFELAKADMARVQAEQRAAAEKARAEHAAEMAAHDAEVARYESEVAAQKVRADFDRRHGLGKGGEASNDDDANRCVTTPEIQANATFKGNTAASIVNGCGQPVDVRICLMTETRGWNCGMSYNVQPQAKWSWSSFHATGPVFMDARVSTSNRKLASPN